MKYVLDFDGVILNIDALKAKMEELQIPLSSRTKDTFKLMKEKDPAFEVSKLVYPDAYSFIKKNAENCIIVSSHVSMTQDGPQDEETSYAYQFEKIILSGMKELGVHDIRVVGKEKKEALSDIKEEFREDCIFVDDRQQYIIEAQELGIRAFFMNRKKTFGSFEFMNFETTHEVSSFVELEEKLK